MSAESLKPFIRDVADFPKPGIVFKDITPLLRNPVALETTVRLLAQPFVTDGITAVAAIESRGFIFGSCVARILGCGFVPIRKPGKLPWTKRSFEYELEYGKDTLEIHSDAVDEHDRVLIIDDVLATGGTLGAATSLVQDLGATIAGAATVIELSFLDGRRKLNGLRFHSILSY
jgi:adenine phosphoribosyltransferase